MPIPIPATKRIELCAFRSLMSFAPVPDSARTCTAVNAQQLVVMKVQQLALISGTIVLSLDELLARPCMPTDLFL